MSRKLRKIVSAIALCMSFTMLAPSAQAAFASTTKTFTYAEQTTNEKVTELVMGKGEKVDIMFTGIQEASTDEFYKKYTCAWVSSDTKVATVSNTGVITAVGKGIAIIQYKVTGGDGEIDYVSDPVKVYVDSYKQAVKIGTSEKNEIKYHVMEMGTTTTLKASGLKETVANRYEFKWSSTDTSVATVDKNGVITPKKPGYSVIQLTVKKLFNGEEYAATPIALHVKEKPKQYTVTFVNEFYDNDTLLGTTTSKFSYNEGFKYEFTTLSNARYSYNKTSGYYCKGVTVTSGVGLNASELTVSGFVYGNATITRKMVRTVVKPEHVVVIDKAIEATCTSEGKTEGSHCLVCGEILEAQKKVAKKEHDYEDGICNECGKNDPNYIKVYTFGDTIPSVKGYSSNFKITFGTDYKFDVIDNIFSDYNGQIVVGIPVTVTNLYDTARSFLYATYDLYSSDGKESDVFSTYFDDGFELESTKLRKGVSMDGYIYITYTGAGDYYIVFGDDILGEIEAKFTIY